VEGIGGSFLQAHMKGPLPPPLPTPPIKASIFLGKKDI